MKTRLLAPLLLAGSVALVACGGDGGSTEATIPADAGLVVNAVEGLQWDLSEYTATAGDVVVVVENTSGQPHNLHFVAADNSQLPQVLDIPQRGSIAVDTVALAAGTYTLICTIPGHANMKATLTVA